MERRAVCSEGNGKECLLLSLTYTALNSSSGLSSALYTSWLSPLSTPKSLSLDRTGGGMYSRPRKSRRGSMCYKELGEVIFYSYLWIGIYLCQVLSSTRPRGNALSFYHSHSQLSSATPAPSSTHSSSRPASSSSLSSSVIGTASSRPTTCTSPTAIV